MDQENLEPQLYCLSGLGADARVFQKLEFCGFQPIHIQWIEPLPQESIADYTKRLTDQIEVECPILIGLSFGGIIAMEIAKQMNTRQVILISSTKNQREIPFYFQVWRWLPFYRLLPAQLMLWLSHFGANWFFSLQTQDERNLLRAILADTNARFLKWAIHQVVTWRNDLVPDNVYHIHGEGDRIFPFQFVQEDFMVKAGGHFMVLNQAQQISQLLQTIIQHPESSPQSAQLNTKQ